MKIKKLIRKIKKIDIKYLNSMKYIRYYRKCNINDKIIFIEAQNSNNFNGNMYYIAKELNNNEKYKSYIIYFSINKDKYNKAKEFFQNKKLNNIRLLKAKSKKYYKILASAKFLFTDTSFTPCFIKKEGQIIFNTWHGTPLKTLGKKVNDAFHDLGNIQKNLAFANYVLYPNEYMMKHMIEDYMLNNISEGKVILEGYPRNEVFFDEQLKKQIRKEEGLTKKEIIVYMPTWRGTVSKVKDKEQQEILIKYLENLDHSLKKNQIMYVNLHPFVDESIDYTKFKKIKKFPNKYETYEFISIADCLITDYSSVLFDFANTRKKIILFTYDEAEYLRDRGLYIELNKLPFPKCKNINELIKEINSTKKYDYTEFIQDFCKYDNKETSKKLCETVILENEKKVKIVDIEKNEKNNILIFTGNLSANGITKSLLNLLESIDLEKNNYFLTYETTKITKNKEILKRLPEKVSYIPIKGKMNVNILKKIIIFLYKKNIINDSIYIKYMKREFEDEIKRIYGNIKFSSVIQFNGYNYKKILLYGAFKCNKIIYVHNDMYNEAIQKKNAKLGILKYAYEKVYDKIALVTKDLLETTCKIANVENKCYIVNNTINYKQILNKAEKEVRFDKKTEANVSLEKLKKILDSNNKKFINIGRFSREKGQDRLIDAFERLWNKDNSIYLIIIGGYGKEHLNIIEKAKNTKCKENIIIIKYVSNPYAILKKCDYFVLSSLYEGFGLVIAEADILKKPVVSTDIVGPKKFMESNGGTLVESSTDGIYKGLELLLNNKVKNMNVDYEKYNKQAIKQFEDLL